MTTGLNGTPMPGFGDDALKPEQKWAIIDFIDSLSGSDAPGYSNLVVAKHVQDPIDLAKGAASFASAPSPLSVSAELRNGFNEVNGWVTTAAEGVPTDKYSYRPVDTVRTFGQLIAHMTYSYNYFCTNACRNQIPMGLRQTRREAPTKTRCFPN